MKSLRRVATCALLGALCNAYAADSQAQPQALVAPPTTPLTAPVIANESPETPPLQSVYFVVANRMNEGGRVEGNSRGIAFTYERDGSDCVLVTAAHVVQGAGEINVHLLMPDLTSGTGYQARIKWIDATRDIAVLRIRNTVACSPVRRYREGVPLGRHVTAFLNTPSSRGMITSGIVGGHWLTEVGPTIVCDMKVYPGHSGSPLLDVQGRLIGMVLSRTQSSEMSAAFALPTSEIEAAFAPTPPPTPVTPKTPPAPVTPTLPPEPMY